MLTGSANPILNFDPDGLCLVSGEWIRYPVPSIDWVKYAGVTPVGLTWTGLGSARFYWIGFLVHGHVDWQIKCTRVDFTCGGVTVETKYFGDRYDGEITTPLIPVQINIPGLFLGPWWLAVQLVDMGWGASNALGQAKASLLLAIGKSVLPIIEKGPTVFCKEKMGC